jgi:hypothetical protein
VKRSVDDRDDDDPPHARLRAELLQVARCGGEEVGRGLLLRGGATRCVDHGFDSAQGVRQALACHDVDPVGAGDGDHVVSLLGEHVDDVAADPAGRARDCDLAVCLHR